jgi:hypothetical protein
MAKPGTIKPGEVRNPKGRPKKEREVRFLEITLSAVTFPEWQKVVEKALEQAKRGDSQARKWLSDYLIGPPQQRSDHTTGGEKLPAATINVYLPDNGRDKRD